MLSREDNERVTRTGPGTPLRRAACAPTGSRRRSCREMRASARSSRCGSWARTSSCSGKPDGGWASSAGTAPTAASTSPTAASRTAGCGASTTAGSTAPTGAASSSPPSPRTAASTRRSGIPATRARSATASSSPTSGGGDPPPFPDYDCFVAPDAYTFAFKGLWECNWLQGVEGGIDPSHVSFLHRFVGEDPREVYGQQFSEGVEGTDKKLSELVGENHRPDIEVEDDGARAAGLRDPRSSPSETPARADHEPGVPQRLRRAVRQPTRCSASGTCRSTTRTTTGT